MQNARVGQGNSAAIHVADNGDVTVSSASHLKEIAEVLDSASEGKRNELKDCMIKTYKGKVTSNLIFQCISDANTAVSLLYTCILVCTDV